MHFDDMTHSTLHNHQLTLTLIFTLIFTLTFTFTFILLYYTI